MPDSGKVRKTALLGMRAVFLTFSSQSVDRIILLWYNFYTVYAQHSCYK